MKLDLYFHEKSHTGWEFDEARPFVYICELNSPRYNGRSDKILCFIMVLFFLPTFFFTTTVQQQYGTRSIKSRKLQWTWGALGNLKRFPPTDLNSGHRNVVPANAFLLRISAMYRSDARVLHCTDNNQPCLGSFLLDR